MAISFAKVNTDPKTSVIGDRVRVVTDVTLDSSYPTGGYTVAPSTFGLTAFDYVDVGALIPATSAVYFAYNYATGKLQAFQSTGAETPNTTNVSTCTGRIQLFGKGFASYSTP